MDLLAETRALLEDVLDLGGRAADFQRTTPLLGAIAEMDSMAAVALIGRMEEVFGFVVDDDDIDGATFATVGSLADYIGSKLQG